MSATTDKLRILLYSHDTVGLGHIRRNQSIACGLANRLDNPAILMVSGARQCTLFDMPKSIDFVTIPSLRKANTGGYEARNPALSLGEAMSLRTEILRSVITSFQPDIFIADKVPLGVYGELEPALKKLRQQSHARCVLGLRDILDDPEQTQMDWEANECNRAIRDYYDELWVYGDQEFYDAGREYGFPAHVQHKMVYTGYLDRSVPQNGGGANESAANLIDDIPGRIALCMVGGGEDGAHVASTFARCKFPQDMTGVVVTGPYMPEPLRDHLRAVALHHPQLRVIDFLDQPEALIRRADRVVSMGGYNTVCELLAFEKDALVIPRVTPRREQLIRAERLQARQLLDMLHPNLLSAQAISDWLAAPQTKTLKRARQHLNLNGLDQLPTLVANLLERPRCGKSTGQNAETNKSMAVAACRTESESGL